MESLLQSVANHCLYDVEEAADCLLLKFTRRNISAWEKDGQAKKRARKFCGKKKAGKPKPTWKIGANFTLLCAKSTFLLV